MQNKEIMMMKMRLLVMMIMTWKKKKIMMMKLTKLVMEVPVPGKVKQGALKKLGYSGPVSITAYGDLKQTPEHVLRGLSSTGVDLQHTIKGFFFNWGLKFSYC